jgi:AraC family transcriptional regulator
VHELEPMTSPADPSVDGGCVRAATIASRRTAVERVLDTMRSRYAEPLTLQDLAREAFLSPYHFNRVFRQTTGVPPGRFLAALRMQSAKHLLLTTDLRVSDVCLDVGYRSLGTFTTHFRQLVGVGPRRLRRLATGFGHVPLEALRGGGGPGGGRAALRVDLARPADDLREWIVFAGLFPTPLPQTRPVACTVDALPATPELTRPDDGPIYVLASGYERSADALGALLAGDDDVRVGIAGPLSAPDGAGATPVALRLRRLDVVDPPILLALPLLLAEAAVSKQPRRAPRRRRSRPGELSNAEEAAFSAPR